MSGDDPADAATEDVVLVCGRTEGDGYAVLRRRGDALEVGAIHEMKEGKPLHGELVRLQKRPEHPLLFDVDVVMNTLPGAVDTLPAAVRSGPAQVATPAYRENWETIFGTKKGAPN